MNIHASECRCGLYEGCDICGKYRWIRKSKNSKHIRKNTTEKHK